MSYPINITDEEYEALAKQIESDKSVVGIDAKKTHILILHLLTEMQQKIDQLEQKIERLGNST